MVYADKIDLKLSETKHVIGNFRDVAQYIVSQEQTHENKNQVCNILSLCFVLIVLDDNDI